MVRHVVIRQSRHFLGELNFTLSHLTSMEECKDGNAFQPSIM